MLNWDTQMVNGKRSSVLITDEYRLSVKDSDEVSVYVMTNQEGEVIESGCHPDHEEAKRILRVAYQFITNT